MVYSVAFKKHIKNIFEKKIEKYSIYMSVELELTNQCNNSCFYCGVSATHNTQVQEIDFAILKVFLDKLSRYSSEKKKIPAISLAGGDPVLYSKFEELITYLKARKFIVMLKGNPSTITSNIIKLLQEYPSIFVRFTWLGDKETQNQFRGKDTIDILQEKTILLKSFGISVIWNLTVGSFNIDNKVKSLSFILETQPSSLVIGRIAKIGRLKNSNLEEISPLKFREFLLKMLNFYHENYQKGISIGFKEKLWLPLLAEENLFDIKKYENGFLRLGCDVYKDTFNVNYKGDIGVCGLLPEIKIGSIFDDDLFFMKRQCVISLSNPSSCHICKYSKFCRGCRAMAFATSGNLYDKDPQCWVDSYADTVN